MPEIFRFRGITIRIYPDHPPPHIHVRYSGAESTVDIVDCRFRAPQRLTPRVMRHIREWVELHRDELLESWDRAQSGVPIGKIPPLR
ncbi:MAG: DUF4160 domain-containing protein [Chloroflexi bacterium]|nr:DUF4160 domain-containing protein [Chloroflexota bacterium]